MKYFKLAYVSCILLIGCLLMIRMELPPSKGEDPLPEFVIGRWVAEFSGSKLAGTWAEEHYKKNRDFHVIRYELDFFRNKVAVKTFVDGSSTSQAFFTYIFTGENKVLITGRLFWDMGITRDGEDLIIKGDDFFIESGRYERGPWIEWPFVGLLTVILPVGLLFIDLSKLSWLFKGKELSSSEKESRGKIYMLIIHRIIPILLFLAGFILVEEFWDSIPFYNIQMPWNGIVPLELGVAFLMMGIKILKLEHMKENEKVSLSRAKLGSTAAFLLGIGIGLSFLGLLLSAGYVFFESFPM